MKSALLSPAQAAVLLDSVIRERIAQCIDIDALREFSIMLQLMLCDMHIERDAANATARAMLGAALHRFADTPESYIENDLDAGCLFCEDERAASLPRD